MWNQEIQMQVKAPNMSEYELPEDVVKKYQDILQQMKGGVYLGSSWVVSHYRVSMYLF